MNQISHIALDIETIPNRALSEHDPAVQEYIKRKLDKLRATDPSMTYEKFSSLNPSFGKIICLSWGCVAEDITGEQVALLNSYTGDEVDILQAFNQQFGGFQNIYAHYNGRSFDIPFIVSRMRQQRIDCRNRHFADLSQPNGWPHLDVMEYHSHGDAAKRLPLAVLATLTGLPSPKHDLDGSTVFEAYQNGEIRRIARYCEWDVATTINLLRHHVGGLDPIPPQRLLSVDVDGELGHLSGAQPNGSCPSAYEESPTWYVSSERIPRIAPTGGLIRRISVEAEPKVMAEPRQLDLHTREKITRSDLNRSI